MLSVRGRRSASSRDVLLLLVGVELSVLHRQLREILENPRLAHGNESSPGAAAPPRLARLIVLRWLCAVCVHEGRPSKACRVFRPRPAAGGNPLRRGGSDLYGVGLVARSDHEAPNAGVEGFDVGDIQLRHGSDRQQAHPGVVCAEVGVVLQELLRELAEDALALRLDRRGHVRVVQYQEQTVGVLLMQFPHELCHQAPSAR
eukprot:4513250-Pyramimonas_sp.AAC.1